MNADPQTIVSIKLERRLCSVCSRPVDLDIMDIIAFGRVASGCCKRCEPYFYDAIKRSADELIETTRRLMAEREGIPTVQEEVTA